MRQTSSNSQTEFPRSASVEATLSPDDLASFERIGVGADLLSEAQVRRVTDEEARELFGIRFSGNVSGIVFPYFDPETRDRTTARLRRDRPEVDSEGKPQNKYISAWGDNRHLYFPLLSGALLRNVTVPIAFVEAEKSALALTAWAKRRGIQLFVIAIGGCWGWRGKTGIEASPNGEREAVRGPLPDLDRLAWDERRVYLIFDANVLSNPKVEQARRALSQTLAWQGAGVHLLDLPQLEGVNGPDDFIGVAGDNAMDVLLRNAKPFTNEAQRASAAEAWPLPEQLGTNLPPVQDLSLGELLPQSFRPYVDDISDRMQTPIDYAAAASVLALAGCVNRRGSIQPKARDTSWRVVANLWGGIIGPPGYLKSPVMQAILEPLYRIESEWFEEYREELAQYKRGGDGDKLPPSLKRLIVNDSTFERLHLTMNENPAGVLVFRDELAGWLFTLERKGREGERQFCLEAWNGDKPFTMDRIGRGVTHVPACCMSMLGGIQPGRLRAYLSDALEDGPTNDGLIQRFQVMVWPDVCPDWHLVDRPPNTRAQSTFENVCRALVRLEPAQLKFSADAQELFHDWLSDLESKLRSPITSPVLVSHLSKYRKLMPALSLLFELADWAAGLGAGDSVSLSHARQAAEFCEYLESHARRVYSCIVSSAMKAARELSKRLKAKEIGKIDPQSGLMIFSARDVYQNQWSGLNTPERTYAALEILEDADWVRSEKGKQGVQCGRPGTRYIANPRIFERE
jgi:putative DNA primase/helicase